MSFAELKLWISGFEMQGKDRTTKPSKHRTEPNKEFSDRKHILPTSVTSLTSYNDSTFLPLVGHDTKSLSSAASNSLDNDQSTYPGIVSHKSEDNSIQSKPSLESTVTSSSNGSIFCNDTIKFHNRKTIFTPRTQFGSAEHGHQVEPHTPNKEPEKRTRKHSIENISQDIRDVRPPAFSMKEAPKVPRAQLPRCNQQKVGATIQKFGGSSKTGQMSMIEKRKEQLQKKWTENKKINPVTKVKWGVCDITGKYKKKYVVDLGDKKN